MRNVESTAVTLTLKQRILRSLLNQYRKFKLKRIDLGADNVSNSLRALLGKARYVFVITHALAQHNESTSSAGLAGSPSARYVQPIVQWQGEDFTVWIGTSASSRKAAEIKLNPNVTLAIGSDSAGANLIIQGTATIHTDLPLRLRYWKPEWRLFFTQGPQDEDYCVISVEPHRLELMDLKRNVTPEPFGLRPVHLVRSGNEWQPGIP